MTLRELKIHLAQDLGSYFGEEVRTTVEKQGLKASPQTVGYLSSVLTKFVDATHSLDEVVSVPSDPGKDPKIQRKHPTLAFMLLEGLSASRMEQYSKLMHLGDLALFTSGYFGERISRSLLDMDYYCAMGGMAYERAGHIHESFQAEKEVNIFFELSKSFKEFAEVFSEVADRALLGNDKDVLKLYEKWLRTRSPRISRMLAESGIISSSGAPRNGGLS